MKYVGSINEGEISDEIPEGKWEQYWNYWEIWLEEGRSNWKGENWNYDIVKAREEETE